MELLPDEFTASDGARLVVWKADDGGDKPLLLWHHATGFHARTYQPLFDRLTPHFNLWAPDARGHGASRDALDVAEFRSWEIYYRDLAELVTRSDRPVVLAGHSFGGTASLVVMSRLKDRVNAALLCDPVLLSPATRLFIRCFAPLGITERLSLSAVASRRRSVFPSRDAAFESYRDRGIFRHWSKEWLRAYVEGGFVDLDDGSVELACRPAWEARSFAVTEPRPFRHLKNTSQHLHALGAERDSTFAAASRRRIAGLKNGRVREVPGSSHFLPMEYPDEVAGALIHLHHLQSCQQE